MSTGMASIKEIEEAVETARKMVVTIFYFCCISAYPAPLKDANLKNISYLKEKFNIEVAYQTIHMEQLLLLLQSHLGLPP